MNNASVICIHHHGAARELLQRHSVRLYMQIRSRGKPTPMASDQTKRKLAAILAADIAGYSRLMGADEEGTLARLKALRSELIDPKNKQHHGRIVKTTGDGILIEFVSVVDAVRCAIEV